MSFLKIFYDKDYTHELAVFDLIPLLDISPVEVLDKRYWKYSENNSKVDEYKLIEYGELILQLVESYKKCVPQINWLMLIFVKKPENFSIKMFFLLCYKGQYDGLLSFVDYNIAQFEKLEQLELEKLELEKKESEQEQLIQVEEVAEEVVAEEVEERSSINKTYNSKEYDGLLSLLKQYSTELNNYKTNPKYYSEQLDNYITHENLEIIKSFGYFNLKYGDSGRYGLWVKE